MKLKVVVPIVLIIFFVSPAIGASGKERQAEVQPSSKTSKPACNFEWVDSKNQTATWSTVSAAFRQELLPDSPACDAEARVYPLKKISRVARCGDAVLVVLEKRTNDKEREEWDRPYDLFNFQLTKKEKTPITAKWTFWSWQFDQLAHFDDSPVPDITFRSMSCVECEPLIMFSALRFNPTNQRWELRRWAKDEEGVAVADWDIDESVDEYLSLSGIASFDRSGHDQLAVFIHYRNLDETDPKKILSVVTHVWLYSFDNGKPAETEIKDEKEIGRIKTRLCEQNPQSCE